MKTPSLLLALLPTLCLTSCYVTPVGGPYAPSPRPSTGHYDRDRHDHDRDRDRHDHDHDRDRHDHDRDRGRPGYGSSSSYGRTDPRSPYSPGGRVVLPREARRVVHGGNTYYTHGSTWYRSSGSGYIVIPRPY